MITRVIVAMLMLGWLGSPAAATEGAAETRAKQQEHAIETPAARENERVQHQTGQPQRIDKSPGGAYAPSDTASSSGKPPDATPKP